MRWFDGPPVARSLVLALVVGAALMGGLVARSVDSRGGATVTVSGTTCPKGFRKVGAGPGEQRTGYTPDHPFTVPSVVCIEE